jgi:hypothetical protein
MRRTLRVTVMVAALAAGIGNAFAEDCDPAVQAALDKQREAYVQAEADLADQNFSRRPGSFASTTCLDNLMKSSGLDIFFKPPSLDTILGMVKNLACQQASQIFNNLLGGGGLNGGGSIGLGEILPGVKLGSGIISVQTVQSSGRGINDASLRSLFR